MTYLLIGYYYTESDSYDILWTMPQCVLVLRLIGLAFDVADGLKPAENLSLDQKQTALQRVPTITEILGFVYYPSAFLVGPQFPFRRYEQFVNAEFPNSITSKKEGFQRLLVGILYLSFRQIGVMMFPDIYFQTDSFFNLPFLWKVAYIGIWGRLSLYKYISCWLLTEGSLMYIGLSYNGKTIENKEDWSACSNVKLMIFETGNKMSIYVQSFNVNTNKWVSQYIYKRLKFLNNQTVSYGAALAFLALWHGFHSGYYVAFFLEFLIIRLEKQVETVYNGQLLSPYTAILEGSVIYKVAKYAVIKFYNISYMGFCVVPFTFLSYSRYKPILASVYYFGLLLVILWSVIYKIFKLHLAAQKKIESTSTSQNTKIDREQKLSKTD